MKTKSTEWELPNFSQLNPLSQLIWIRREARHESRPPEYCDLEIEICLRNSDDLEWVRGDMSREYEKTHGFMRGETYPIIFCAERVSLEQLNSYLCIPEELIHRLKKRWEPRRKLDVA